MVDFHISGPERHAQCTYHDHQILNNSLVYIHEIKINADICFLYHT